VIDLAPQDHQALKTIAAAGADGLKGCREIPLQTLVRLEDLGLAAVELNLAAVHAVATPAGHAFIQRTAL
jgi:hypothetical protein